MPGSHVHPKCKCKCKQCSQVEQKCKECINADVVGAFLQDGRQVMHVNDHLVIYTYNLQDISIEDLREEIPAHQPRYPFHDNIYCCVFLFGRGDTSA